jgi:hypothetical protein
MPQLGIGQIDAQLPKFGQEGRQNHLEPHRSACLVPQRVRLLPNVAFASKSLRLVSVPTSETGQQ